MMSIKLVLLIVLYKTEIQESLTLNSLSQFYEKEFECEIIVWDNSPIPLDKVHIAILNKKIGKCTYISSPENTWLSKVYNKVITEFTGDYYLILDQDSKIPPNFFNILYQHILNNVDVKLFLPMVFNKGKLVSPGKLNYFKGKHLKFVAPGKFNAKNTLAITSGLTISNDYIKKYPCVFDERLSLYGIDTKFMIDFSRREDWVYILPLELEHNTVLWSNPSADVMYTRFRNLKQSWRIVFSDRPLSAKLAIIYGFASSFKLTVKYMDSRFISDYLKR